MSSTESKFPIHRFTCNPQTGQLFRDGKLMTPHTRNRYLEARSGFLTVKAHRLVWRLVHGVWPTKIIDHINKDKHDNRIANLREADFAENGWNAPAPRTNTSGFKGVHFDKHENRWKIHICFRNKTYSWRASSGVSAILAAALIRRELHGEFAA